MTASLEHCLWPNGERERLTVRLAEAAGLERIEAPHPFHLAYQDLTPRLSAKARRQAPAVLRVRTPAADGDEAGALLAVVGFAGTSVRVLAPDGAVVAHDEQAVARLRRARHEQGAGASVQRLLARAQLPAERQAAVSQALLAAMPGTDKVVDGYRLARLAPSLGAALRQAGLLRALAQASIAYGAQLVLLVAAWWMIGTRAGSGLRGGALATWLGVLAALVLARLAASWAAGRLALGTGDVLRTRLLHGLLGLDTEPIRAQGIGQLIGRLMETEAVESLALGGGLQAVAAVFELATGIVVLALGAVGGREVALLGLWLTGAAILALRVARSLRAWSARRLALTHDLVERMVGHRTLVAQQPPELRHLDEESMLADYQRAGHAFDRAVAALVTVVPRGWLLLGLVALAPELGVGARGGSGAALAAVATSLGGVLFVYGALRRATQAFPALMAAAVAWEEVAPLLAGAGAWPAPVAAPAPLAAGDGALISARELGFSYPGRTVPVLKGCSLEIGRGDRILLEGPSGGGKSTLGSILAGLRPPSAGELRLGGRGREELGAAAWRGRVGSVPQFHENHVFSASLLFNLLLGREWPPSSGDAQQAWELCQELGLGPLLARMPLGLLELVGESGWQLSHGERSRLYIARSLLQRLDARILDESFAALDPETLERTLACVLRRADTLVVIAHP